jgi:cation:H+ antiporter
MSMNVVLTTLLFLVGLLLIVKGGDWFLDGAVWIAETTGVPRFIIGATIVSLATTLPELTVSVTGVLKNEVDLAVGNAVGSVTANIGLILGISVLFLPSAVSKKQFNVKALLMAAGAILLTLLCANGTLPLLPSLLLFAVFILYLINNVRDARTGMAEQRGHEGGRRSVSRRQMLSKLLLFGVGIAAIVTGSQLLIDHGSALALLLGVPSSIIGVTLVAVGTSLPELVTTLTALVKKEASMSVGNIIGANVIDLTMILPICSAVSGGRLAIGSQTTALDLPACLTLCLVAVLPPLFKGRFYRWQGVLMLGLYAAYVVMLVR